MSRKEIEQLLIDQNLETLFTRLEYHLAESYLPDNETIKPADSEIKKLENISTLAKELEAVVNELNPAMHYRLSELLGISIHEITTAKSSSWAPLSISKITQLLSFQTDSVISDFKENYANKKHGKPISDIFDFWIGDLLKQEMGPLSDESNFVVFVAIILDIQPEAAKMALVRDLRIKREKKYDRSR